MDQNSPVFGSLAYDFRHGSPETEEYSTAPEREAQPVLVRQSLPARRAVPRQSVSIFAVLGIAAAAFLLASAILLQARLVGISAESAALQTELTTLQERQRKLLISHESAFRPERVERYATEELHMQKPAANQIVYIDTSGTALPEETVPEEINSFSQQLRAAVSRILAYLR